MPFCRLQLALSLWVGLAISVSPAAEQDWSRYQANHRAMGSLFQVTIYAQDQAEAGRAIRAALDRIDQIDQRLSDYHPRSELSQLSESSPAAEPVPLSADLVDFGVG